MNTGPSLIQNGKGDPVPALDALLPRPITTAA
jgi:hypothetical protein